MNKKALVAQLILIFMLAAIGFGYVLWSFFGDCTPWHACEVPLP